MKIWWCNQSRDWIGERRGNVVCASEDMQDLTYRRTVGKVMKGDLVVHYRRPYVVAVSRAKEDSRHYEVLPPLAGQSYKSGWRFETDYFDLDPPLHRDSFSINLVPLIIKHYPINKNGHIRQGYFFPFDAKGLGVILSQTKASLPEWLKLATTPISARDNEQTGPTAEFPAERLAQDISNIKKTIQQGWEYSIQNWWNDHRSLDQDLLQSAIDFFRKSFIYCRCSNDAWFGVHESVISLTVGGIWLASINLSSKDSGVWLLLDRECHETDFFHYSRVKSAEREEKVLFWGHSDLLSVIPNLLTMDFLWESYSSASLKVRDIGIAASRDSVQIKRNKTRLTEIWQPSLVTAQEVAESEPYFEGSVQTITVNVYERNASARQICLSHHGHACVVCGFDFIKVYGTIGIDAIHVHHLLPLSEIKKNYNLDPIADLRPVCPNCHAILHRRKPPYTIQEAKDFIHNNKNRLTTAWTRHAARDTQL